MLCVSYLSFVIPINIHLVYMQIWVDNRLSIPSYNAVITEYNW